MEQAPTQHIAKDKLHALLRIRNKTDHGHKSLDTDQGGNPKPKLKVPIEEVNAMMSAAADEASRLMFLAFGVGAVVGIVAGYYAFRPKLASGDLPPMPDILDSYAP